MTKTNTLLLAACTLLFLNSCSPRISSSLSKTYPPLESTQEVRVIDLNGKLPGNAELLGELKIDDSGFSTQCDYETEINAAKIEARKVGGNALKIISHQYPDHVSSCHRIKVSIYKVTSFDESPVAAATTIDNSPQSVQATSTDTIQMTKAGGTCRYKYKGEEISAIGLQEVIQNNATAMQYFNKAKGTAGFVNIIAYCGGFLIGYPIGTAIGGRQPNWTMAIIGGGLVVLAIPIAGSINRNISKAVNAYNQDILTPRKETGYNVRLGMNQSGLGLAIRF